MNAETRGSREPARGFRHARLRFRRWRGRRPFWAGLFTLLAGAPILYFPYADLRLGNVTIAMATTAGSGSLIIGVLLLTLGPALWFQRNIRVVAGVGAMVLALVSLPVSNFGGFLLGFLLAMLGGTMALAWRPGTPAPARAADLPASAVADEAAAAEEAEPAEDPNAPAAEAPAQDADAYAAPYPETEHSGYATAPTGGEWPGSASGAESGYGHGEDAVLAPVGMGWQGSAVEVGPGYPYDPYATVTAPGGGAWSGVAPGHGQYATAPGAGSGHAYADQAAATGTGWAGYATGTEPSYGYGHAYAEQAAVPVGYAYSEQPVPAAFGGAEWPAAEAETGLGSYEIAPDALLHGVGAPEAAAPAHGWGDRGW